ncbi:putative RNA methyltransferase [Sporosarcina sp. 179-K 3D1 HS]|uniref:putative RNA methyltransferase n=1 Tax=Sporosarcina sp. 179-K 3D1 HS TaxID=3232169 RepID=UPI0039A080A9
MTVSKKMMAAEILEKNERLFRCPICSTDLALVDKTRFVCQERHSFDLAKQGYVNLAPQAHETKYDKELFIARSHVMGAGFFDPTIEFIAKAIRAKLGEKSKLTILDAGCGEGTHLMNILGELGGVGVGVDLAKEGIMAAAKAYSGTIWTVADLANCPFHDARFDVILNILSPANYAEFTRLLRPGGWIVKVVPEKRYLQELREIFYEGKEAKEETDPVLRFSDQVTDVWAERITYPFPLDRELLASLIRMTPLTWGASEGKVAEALESGLSSITIDYNVMIGRKREGEM